ncbi:hypothetical protein [Falsiroseomonas algicola]|uniref:hypothetical protein n=1 Tax=Falsiroseomonas algicola TaxID=2716930 RepID=UPI001A998CD0|nr:hypothetical protein [Falsiroseomonas algicola]
MRRPRSSPMASMAARLVAGCCTALSLALLLGTRPAQAHVKWFAPYIVAAPQRPIAATLEDGWFWLGCALVLFFFLAARMVEISRFGAPALGLLDRITAPLWRRLDAYVRAIIGAFFVAIFAVGGIYLTPDLKTPHEWVSWIQLLIAAGVFFRRTMPLSAAGIVALWVLAVRDYGLFHLLDYLALGLATAAYLVLAASRQEAWRAHRFEVLRWGLAIALMWSSLEKFAYPDWFHPLVDEKPFLTLGLPRDAFIPMAGVAEFTLGFGLVWTPLIRRLSGAALLVTFSAAVLPFGRIDLIGHGLIMAILAAVVAEQDRQPTPLARWQEAIRQPLPGIPLGLGLALVVFASCYTGLHGALYPAGSYPLPPPSERSTHGFNPDHPHGPGMRSHRH